MKKQLLSEEFTRMQKMAGIVNEIKVKPSSSKDVEAFKQFIISELGEVLEDYIESGENLFGEPFDAPQYEELKNSINNLTTLEEIESVVEDFLYENVYEKDYEVKDFFQYIYRSFIKG